MGEGGKGGKIWRGEGWYWRWIYKFLKRREGERKGGKKFRREERYNDGECRWKRYWKGDEIWGIERRWIVKEYLWEFED